MACSEMTLKSYLLYILQFLQIFDKTLHETQWMNMRASRDQGSDKSLALARFFNGNTII